MNIKTDPWILNECIPRTQKHKLWIILKSLGFATSVSADEWPYLKDEKLTIIHRVYGRDSIIRIEYVGVLDHYEPITKLTYKELEHELIKGLPDEY